MPDPILIITDAGRSEAVTAAGGGLDVEITEVGIGTGQWVPSASATALQNEVKRLPVHGAQKTTPNSVTLQFRDQSTDAYTAYEVGFYLSSGTLFAIFASDTDAITTKAAELKLVWGKTLVLATLPDDSVVATPSLSFVPPTASESQEGIVELATQAEANAGTDDIRALTAKKLKDHSTVAHFPIGTRMLFQNSTAPTGWIKDTSLNDRALRIVNGTVGSGGTYSFSSVFSRTATDGHVLTASQSGLPNHRHISGQPNGAGFYGLAKPGGTVGRPTGDGSDDDSPYTSYTGGQNASQAHSHGVEMRVLYVDFIVATRHLS